MISISSDQISEQYLMSFEDDMIKTFKTEIKQIFNVFYFKLNQWVASEFNNVSLLPSS